MEYYPKTTHLTQPDRFIIERLINAGSSFRYIAERLSRHPSTISREIKRNRHFISVRTTRGNDCALSFSCTTKHLCGDICSRLCRVCEKTVCREYCTDYIPVHCSLLDQKPYICNTCSYKTKCHKCHAYYNAHIAQASYLRQLADSRRGIRVSSSGLKHLDELISPLLKKGQSLAHIYATHEKRIRYSRKTIYNYINASAFKARNLDLPRKVRYKRRKLRYPRKIEYKYRIGRTYTDFKSYLEEHPGTNVVEMDTVKGKRTKGKVLLTFIFCNFSFMLIFLLDAPSQECVINIFDLLTNILGLREFKRLFPVILTDNGCEFKDVEALEFTKNGSQRTRMFYCDPQAAWQKPHIEKGHEFIRYVIPKGTPLDGYSQKGMTLLSNHINSFARDSLYEKCPFEAGKEFLRTKLLESLELERVPPDSVHLKPVLLKH